MKITEPQSVKLVQQLSISKYMDNYGHWSISCKDPRPLSEGEITWYQTVKMDPEQRQLLLHSDGEWRECTVNELGQYTGYFPTKEAAIICMQQQGITEYCEFVPFWESKKIEAKHETP